MNTRDRPEELKKGKQKPQDSRYKALNNSRKYP